MPLPQHPKTSDDFYKASVHVPVDVMNYFERMVLGRGWQQNIFAHLILAFHTECIRRGITSQWEPDNVNRISAILSELSFSPVVQPTPTKKKNAKSKPLSD